MSESQVLSERSSTIRESRVRTPGGMHREAGGIGEDGVAGSRIYSVFRERPRGEGGEASSFSSRQPWHRRNCRIALGDADRLPFADSMFSAGKVGSRVEPTGGIEGESQPAFTVARTKRRLLIRLANRPRKYRPRPDP